MSIVDVVLYTIIATVVVVGIVGIIVVLRSDD